MSTLKVTNIQATGETASRAVSGVAAFEIHHSGDSPTINESVNASSLTDNSAGDSTYAFTNDFSSGYYRANSMSTEDGTIGYVVSFFDRSNTRSTSSLRIQTLGMDDNAYEDGQYTTTIAHGDLA